MAETDQETGLLNGTVTHSLSDDNGMVDTTHVQVEHDGMSEELLRQALAEVNAYDSVSLAEASDCSEVCDTGQDTADANSDLGVNNSTVSHISSNPDGGLVHSEDQLLNSGSESIFHNGSDGLMVNGGSDEVMDVEANGTFTVDIGSLPEGRIISIPNNIMARSVIIPRSQHDQLHHTLEGNDDGQLLQDETNSDQQMDSEYINENESHLLQTNTNSQLAENGSFSHPHSITVSASSGIQMSQEDLQSVIQQLAQQQALSAQKKQSPGNTLPSQETISFTLVSPSQQNARSPPLGSSQNPIRIIQQGNRYTPMQQLTPEQLQQIMQVVQQQHVSKNSQDNGGAVIFNPQTNTRIMYRVIYPSELHKSQNSSTQYQILRPSTASQEQQTGTSQQKRPYRKRKEISTLPVPSADDEEKDKNVADAPELSKEEKEERKKHRPRTRSGRVSKPPKHMVQDYKHIHVLDWDEDYDDSDGGYSDFKHSDEEKVKQEGEEESLQSPEFFPALGAGRPRNHKCQTCEKSYIGQAGLNRHYRLNPDHCINPSENGSISSLHNGSIDGDDSKDASLLQDNSMSRMSDTAAEVAKVTCNSIENYSEDSNTQDSLNSLGATSPVVRRGRGRGSYRGRWAHLKHNAQIRRKNKLKELMKHCTDEELMEVVLPRLVNSISLWEYLMMKSEKGGTRPQIDVIYHEFETLRKHVKKACADYMHPMSQEELEDDNLQCKMIKVADKSLALCLDLEPVTYIVREMPPGDSNSFSSLHNKLSAAAITIPSNHSIPSVGKDAAECTDIKPSVSQHSVEHGENPPKKPRISQFSCPNLGKNVHTTSPLPVISNTFTVTAQLPLLTEENGHYARSDSSLSSISSLSASSATSPQSQPVHVRVATSNVTSSTISALSSQSYTSSSSKLISTSNISSGRSPFVHIACPTTKTQTVSYILADPKSQTASGARGGKTQPVPVLINQPVGASSQILPSFIMSTSGSLTGIQQKYIVTTPRSQPGTLPVVLSTPAVQQAGTTTMLVTTASTSGHRVIVRQPPPPHIHQTRIIIPTPSKAQTAAENSAFTSTTLSSSSNNSRSLLNTLKPTEVKVSRQLFHDTTSANTPTVPIINGCSNIKSNSVVSQDVHSVFQQLPARTTSISSGTIIIGNGTDSSSRTTKLISARTLVTPPSGQQFITSPNKAVGGVQVSIPDGDMDDIEVLGSMEFPDDLGTLNTSSDSLNGSLSAGSQSVVNDMAATSSVSEIESFTVTQAADSVTNLVDMTGVTADSQFGLIDNGNINGLDALTYMNGSSSEFPTSSSVCNKIKNNSISSSSLLTFSVSTSPSTYASSVSDFINISKPSPMVFTSALKEGVPRLQTSSYCMDSTSTSQEFKTDTSSITMADMSSLQFGDQGVTSGHLNGNSILQSDDPQEDTINMLSDQLTSSDPQEADVQFLDSREGVTADGLVEEEENQLLLSEGSSIYQTEDGTVIIQSANGITYQLQGTQGLSLETVQALLSGTLDQLNLGEGVVDNVQTDVQML